MSIDPTSQTADLANRLTEVRRNSILESAFTYDNNGNRLTGPEASTSYTYDAQDRLGLQQTSTTPAHLCILPEPESASRTP